MEKETYEQLGQIAYNAYKIAAHGRSLVTSSPLPEWGFLPGAIQEAWAAAAKAVSGTLGK